MKTNINLTNKEIKDIRVWYLCEGFDVEPTRVSIKSNADVHDLKQSAFIGKNDSFAYQAFFRERRLTPGETVPQDTTETQFVIFKKPSLPTLTDNSSVIIKCFLDHFFICLFS